MVGFYSMINFWFILSFADVLLILRSDDVRVDERVTKAMRTVNYAVCQSPHLPPSVLHPRRGEGRRTCGYLR